MFREDLPVAGTELRKDALPFCSKIEASITGICCLRNFTRCLKTGGWNRTGRSEAIENAARREWFQTCPSRGGDGFHANRRMLDRYLQIARRMKFRSPRPIKTPLQNPPLPYLDTASLYQRDLNSGFSAFLARAKRRSTGRKTAQTSVAITGVCRVMLAIGNRVTRGDLAPFSSATMDKP